ncbi:MAG: hypothetical protein AAF288_14395 [Planctomycetota bacterium]
MIEASEPKPAYPTHPMFCRACGRPLMPDSFEPARCLGCERAFDPRNDKTYLGQPMDENGGTDPAERAARWAFAALYGGGLLLGFVMHRGWYSGGNAKQSPAFAESLFLLLAVWPVNVVILSIWLTLCVWLALVATGRHFDERTAAVMFRGPVLSVLMSVPLASITSFWLLIGVLAGLLAGLFRRRLV